MAMDGSSGRGSSCRRAGQSFGYTVRATADGGCVFTGHTTEDSAGELDLFIVKVGAVGQAVPRR